MAPWATRTPEQKLRRRGASRIGDPRGSIGRGDGARAADIDRRVTSEVRLHQVDESVLQLDPADRQSVRPQMSAMRAGAAWSAAMRP
jgi:hypothetical protein